MDRTFEVALVFSGHEWVESFHRHCTNTGIIKIRSLVYDISALESEEFDACIIADAHPGLTQALVRNIHDKNQAVISVCENTNESMSFVSQLGVDAVFPNDIGAKLLSEKISELLKTMLIDTKSANTQTTMPLETFIEEDSSDVEANGRVISCIGAGGTGTTEISMLVAQRLVDCVLVDLDFEHPSIAMRLGAEISPNVLDAIEHTMNDHDSFSNAAHQTKAHAFIPGVTHSSFAKNITPTEITELTKILKNNYTNTVLDLGRSSETSRFTQVINTAISKSDVLVVVIEPTPVGVLRLLEIVAQISSLRDSQSVPEIIVVANKHEGNKEIEHQIQKEISSLEPIATAIFVPHLRKYQAQSWIGKDKKARKLTKALNELVVAIESSIALKQELQTLQNQDSEEFESELEPDSVKEIA